ncbi:MAG TPA: anaerobic sulfatase maturase [Opitutaceae bacterium]|nr:anaerobic sulfatase maturase [Opitutaceae bacterium]
MLAKPVGAACNLECSYCFYREKDHAPEAVHSAVGRRMSLPTIERYVRDYLASQPGEEVQFAWQGGEPTLAGLEFFQQVVEIQRRYAAGRRVSNALQTNGTLLDDAWGEFLAREKFLVGISIDGPKTMHDPFRIDHGRRPTWARVMRGIKLLKKHRVEFNTLTVVHRRNVRQAAAVYEFLREEGSGFMQFIPLVERRPTPGEAARGLAHGSPRGIRERLVSRAIADHEVAPECPPPERVGDFLTTIYDSWVRRDVGRVFVQLFDVALAAWVHGRAGLCVFEERCGRAFALEQSGDLYACDHFVYPEHRLGNIHATALADLGHSAAAARFGDIKADLPRVCRECPVRFACNGDCPKHRFVEAGPGEPGVSYLCPAYRKFFTHIAPTMERMAALVRAGRPAADVMRR